MEEEEEEDQREMARTKETKRMEPSAETDKSHLGKRDTRNALADRRTNDLVTFWPGKNAIFTIRVVSHPYLDLAPTVVKPKAKQKGHQLSRRGTSITPGKKLPSSPVPSLMCRTLFDG